MSYKEQQRLDRISRNIERLEDYTSQLKSLESQARAIRLRRNKVIIKLKDAGLSERKIGGHANMAGPTVHEIYHTNKEAAA